MKDLYSSLKQKLMKSKRFNKPSWNTLTFYRQFVKEGDLVFDIGANIGDRTEVFEILGARVIAVEPQKKCLQQLEARFYKSSQVTIVGKAIDVSEGARIMKICSTDPTISTMSDEWVLTSRFSGNYKWDKSQKVETIRFDNLIDEYGMPAFVKIDVEGYEFNVISSLTKAVSALSFEFTQEQFVNSLKCFELMNQLGDYLYNVSFGESLSFENREWQKDVDLIKFLNEQFVTNNLLWGDIYSKLVV